MPKPLYFQHFLSPGQVLRVWGLPRLYLALCRGHSRELDGREEKGALPPEQNLAVPPGICRISKLGFFSLGFSM